MTYYKTAAPCEVCGERVKHAGNDKGFVVGYTTKSVPRLVHERCRRQWIEDGEKLMSKWPELRPHVFRTLQKTLQFRIQRCRDAFQGGRMSRTRSAETFQPSPELYDWLKNMLEEERPRKKGAIKRWFEQLLREQAAWVTFQESPINYTTFYNVVVDLERKLEWQLSRQVSSAAAATAIPPVDLPALPTPPPPVHTDLPHETTDLPAMAQVAHMLIDLALQRQDRDGIQLTLECLAHLLQPPKKTVSPPST